VEEIRILLLIDEMSLSQLLKLSEPVFSFERGSYIHVTVVIKIKCGYV
jgi:hypothetical protein